MAEQPGQSDPADDDATSGDGFRSREVVVPLRLYKTITVFSTLISVAFVLLGFFLLDAATQRASVPASAVNPYLAVGGLAAIAAGGLVYAFASRFRTRGMGKDKDDADESTDNG